MYLKSIALGSILALALPAALSAGDCGSCTAGMKKTTATVKNASYTKEAHNKGHHHAKSLVDVAAKDGRFSILAGALQKAGLVDALSGDAAFTVFAPTDAAFAKLPPGTLESLSQEQLIGILKSHVIPGRIGSSDALAANGQSLHALSGAPLAISVKKGDLSVAGSKVLNADIKAKNGVIHVIDTVIIPDHSQS